MKLHGLVSRLRRWLLGICAFALWSFPALGDNWIWMDGTINDKLAHFVFDTGGDRLILFQQGATRLGLVITNAPNNPHPDQGRTAAVIGTTEECDLEIEGNSARTTIDVLDSADVIASPDRKRSSLDGLVGWGAVSQNRMRVDALHGVVIWLQDLPQDIAQWTKLRIQTNSPILRLEAVSGGPMEFVLDTGHPFGVTLPAAQWVEWKTSHTNQPITAIAYSGYCSGSRCFVAAEETWAKRISVGPLVLEDVPVEEGQKINSIDESSSYHGILGMAALRRMDLIIDGQEGFAYFRPNRTPPPPYEYNRLGAVFVPRTWESNDLEAHVVPNSPGFRAGIREGDLLVSIDGQPVTNWRVQKLRVNDRFRQPAGTRLKLAVLRDKQTLDLTAVLQEILQSDSKDH